MDLVVLYNNIIKSYSIGNFNKKRLKSILLYEDPIRIKQILSNMIILTDSSIVRCVCNYYAKPRQPLLKITTKSLGNRCFYTRKQLELDDEVDQMQCRECHLLCLQKEKAGELQTMLFKRKR